MRISIVTISYNQAPFLTQAIRSVIEQDYPNLEYIVVDPGSTDGSREIIERYRHRIDKIIFEPDMGPADGLNKGFAHGTGEIFGFLNSDDYLLPGALSIIGESFRVNLGIDILSGNALIVNRDGAKLRKFFARKYTPVRSVYGAAMLPQVATFFRAAAFENAGGFNIENRVAWDGELWLEMALRGYRFGRINALLAACRVYPETITSQLHFGKEYQWYRDQMFNKVMNRDKRGVDRFIKLLMKVIEYGGHPKMFFERLFRGPEIPTAKN